MSTVAWKKVSIWLSSSTSFTELLYSTSSTWTRPSSMLNFCVICHSPSCQTVSNAFLKLMNFWRRFCWCCRYLISGDNILNSVLARLKPACSSSFSVVVLMQFYVTLSMTLFGWMSRFCSLTLFTVSFLFFLMEDVWLQPYSGSLFALTGFLA